MIMRTRGLALAGAASVLILLAACRPLPVPEATEDAQPSVIATPELTEPATSTSPLESNEFVIVARTANLGYTVAANNADFTIEQFTSTRPLWTQHDQYGLWASAYLGTGKEAPVGLGPSVLLPLSVTEVDGGGAVVEFCRADHALGSDDPAAALLDGHIARMTIIEGENGTLQFEISQGSTTECDATGATLAYFKPAPEPLGVLEESDARAPLE